MSEIAINSDRLWKSLADMARIGATKLGGCKRLALTDEDRAGRDLFVSWARAAGCGITIDEMGNIFARREGSRPEAEPVMAGSHLDTQPTGGRFDGVFGVLAGLEVLRTLADHKLTTARPFEVAVWTNEEGSRFQPAMMGSAVFAGAMPLEEALGATDQTGATAGAELARIQYKGEAPCRPRPLHAYLEAHIEQGPVLEAEELTIGVVTGIQGIKWFKATLEGINAHAGTTPMEVRRDPLVGAARIVEAFGGPAQPVRLDSQCKYAVVARGQADAYLRMPTSRTYVEKIWDHAAGSIIATEAGAVVTDITGAALDFTHGRQLETNRGVVCAVPHVHGRIIEAIERLGIGATV